MNIKYYAKGFTLRVQSCLFTNLVNNFDQKKIKKKDFDLIAFLFIYSFIHFGYRVKSVGKCC